MPKRRIKADSAAEVRQLIGNLMVTEKNLRSLKKKGLGVDQYLNSVAKTRKSVQAWVRRALRGRN